MVEEWGRRCGKGRVEVEVVEGEEADGKDVQNEEKRDGRGS